MIRPARALDHLDWARMRASLWPDEPSEVLAAELASVLANPVETAFVAECDGGALCGFVEVSVRSQAEGCDAGPVGYIEGWFVAPGHRRRGIGRALVRAAEGWAASRGCRWMASDALAENALSHAAHAALGYRDVGRLVHFARLLGDPPGVLGSLPLDLLPDTYTVVRLARDVPLPAWADGPFISVTRTADELSVVCQSGAVPAAVRQETGWRCLRVAGTLDFALVGVLASLVTPLAAAGVSVFSISTFDTDYLMVREGDLDQAKSVLRQAGHRIGV